MPRCPFLNTCPWIKKYATMKGARVNHFINSYCMGDNLRRCVRKKVAESLGGREFVPENMQPDGRPVNGTDDSEWPEEVKKIVKSFCEPHLQK